MRKLERYGAAALIAATGVAWQTTASAASALDSGNCPAAERAQIPEHLQSLGDRDDDRGPARDHRGFRRPPAAAASRQALVTLGRRAGRQQRPLLHGDRRPWVATAIPTSTSTTPPPRRCAPSATSSPRTASTARVTGATARSTGRSARARAGISTSTPTGARIANSSMAAVTRATCSCGTTPPPSNW